MSGKKQRAPLTRTICRRGTVAQLTAAAEKEKAVKPKVKRLNHRND